MSPEPPTSSAQQRRYSLTAITLHWLIAAAILFQIAVGWGLHALGARAFSLFQLHKSIGLTILLLSFVRLGLRLLRPNLLANEGNGFAVLARLVHASFYAVMIAAPLSGWVLVSTAKVRVPTLWFGLVRLPHLPMAPGWNADAAEIHSALAWITLALLALHVAGAFRHHFLLRDGLMWRMVPGRSAIALALLLASVAGAFLLGRAALPKRVPAAASLQPQPVKPVAATRVQAMPVAVATQVPPLAIPPMAARPTPAWSIQQGGHLGFSVGSADGAISGNFTKWFGRIHMDPAHPETADIHLTINLASATVGDSYKDDMLQGADFFATSDYPNAKFDATKVRKVGPNRFRADGTLTLKGSTAPQSINFSLTGAGRTVLVKGAGTVHRQRFQVGIGDSAASLTPDVSIDFSFTASSSDR